MGWLKNLTKGVGSWIRKVRDKRKDKGKKNLLGPLAVAAGAFIDSDRSTVRPARPGGFTGIPEGKPNYNNYTDNGIKKTDFMDSVELFFKNLKWWGWCLVGISLIYIKDTMLTQNKNQRWFFGK